jgi:hypothetical protein
MPRKSFTHDSPAAPRIKSLRTFLGLTTGDFATELGCSDSTILAWEAGLERPSPEAFINLGNLAGDPSCWFFWSCAGLYGPGLMRVLPPVRLEAPRDGTADLAVVHAGGGKHLFSRPLLHAIPILPVRVATPGVEGDRVDDLAKIPASGFIASPSDWCPNPRFTSCLRVAGDSMAPLICDGYIIVVDTSQVEREKLNGAVVVAWDKKHGLMVARFAINNGRESMISANPEYSSLVVERSGAPLRIIGKVLWWVGRDSSSSETAA